MSEPDPSASKAALFSACAYAFRRGTEWVEERGRAAIQGDQFHVAIAPEVDPSITNAPFPPTTKWHRERMAQATDWIARNYVPGWRAEVAYAYDPRNDTARILGYNIGRKYEKHGKLPHELAGSTDIGWQNYAAHVRDWKTGRAVTDAVWPQLEWLGLFSARAHGLKSAVVGPLHVTDYGVGDTMIRELDESDLDRIANGIREQLASVEDAWPTPGVHCNALYCPARAGCDVYQINRKVA